MAEAYGKNRQWTAVLYNENMREDWKTEIDNLLQLPYAYCVHDKGLEIEKNERRKVHTHIVLVFPAPTTYKHAKEVFGRLSATGKRALNACEPVYSARHIYDYLIHDTEDCRKKGKYLFTQEERIIGNNYDIGSYEQVSQQDKNEAFDKLTDLVFTENITNFADLVLAARAAYPEETELMRDVMRAYSGYFDRLIKGNFFRANSEKTCNPAKINEIGADGDYDRRGHGGEVDKNLQESTQDARERAYAEAEKEALEEAEYFDRLEALYGGKDSEGGITE